MMGCVVMNGREIVRVAASHGYLRLMAPTLLYQKFGNLVLAVQGSLPPSDEDWAGYVDLYRRGWHRHRSIRILVVSAGGSPSNLQQRQVNELVPGLALKVAVVALAAPLEQVVRRLIVVNDDMRMFPPDGMEQALDFLAVAEAERPAVREAITAMQQEMAGSAS
jgi:hypothetical protein